MPQELTHDGIPVNAPNASPNTQVQDDLPSNIQNLPEVDPNEPAGETDDTVNLDAFLSLKNTEVPEVKPPEQPVEKQTDVQKTNPPPVVPVLPQKQVEQRDYSGLDETDVPLFKNMSNDAFRKLKPVYLEHKKLADEIKARDAKIAELEKGVTKIPDSYYEHPQSFVLTPEFVEATNTYTNAQQLNNHWQQQLASIRKGAATFKNIELVDNKWQLVERDADAEAEVHIIAQLTESRQALIGAQQNLRNLSSTHQNRVKESTSWVMQKEGEYFPVFDKPEFKEKYEPVIQDTIKKLPAPFQRSPLARLLAKSLITNFELNNVLQNYLKQNPQPSKPGKPNIQKQAGPTAGDVGASNGNDGNGSEVTFEDFEKLKQGV